MTESLLHRCRLSSGHQKRIKRRKGAWTPDTDIPESVWARFYDNSTHDDAQRREDTRQQTEGVRTRTEIPQGFGFRQGLGVCVCCCVELLLTCVFVGNPPILWIKSSPVQPVRTFFDCAFQNLASCVCPALECACVRTCTRMWGQATPSEHSADLSLLQTRMRDKAE